MLSEPFSEELQQRPQQRFEPAQSVLPCEDDPLIWCHVPHRDPFYDESRRTARGLVTVAATELGLTPPTSAGVTGGVGRGVSSCVSLAGPVLRASLVTGPGIAEKGG